MKMYLKEKICVVASILLIGVLGFTGCTSGTTEKPSASTTETPSADISKSGEATRSFTDSVGRTVEIPENLTKIAISGPLAQITVFALAPDKMAGIASEWSSEAEKLLDTKYYELPVLGQLYGGKGEMNLETLLSSGAEIVIDVGEPKGTVVEDLDALTSQTGIPFVHITATTETTGDMYRKLGELLGMEEEAEKLASYCEKIYNRTCTIAEKVKKVNLLYCLGDAGLNVIAQGSYHAEIIDLLSDNLAVVESPSSKGSGNEVDMEQILLWNPDVIIFANDSIYDTVGGDSAWQQINAISTGKYYEVPFGPYNWLGFPPSVQRYLGMMWMAKLLYPDEAQYDLYTEVTEYFRLFYHTELTEEQYGILMENSLIN